MTKEIYLTSNVNAFDRLKEINFIERNAQEIAEGKDTPRSLENKYKEFLYFMGRLESTKADQDAVQFLASEFKRHDNTTLQHAMDEQRAKVDEAQERAALGTRVANRYAKIIDYFDIDLPPVTVLAGSLDMNLGVPLRAKYFGTGVSSKNITTWDQLLYAIAVTAPTEAEIDGEPVYITTQLGPNTTDPRLPYNRLDKSSTMSVALSNYEPTK